VSTSSSLTGTRYARIPLAVDARETLAVQVLTTATTSAAGESMYCYSAKENSQIVAGVRVEGGL
jgi:hypothetical protein